MGCGVNKRKAHQERMNKLKQEEARLDKILAELEKQSESKEPSIAEAGGEGKRVKLALIISCQELKNMDKYSKSDPMVVVWSKDASNKEYEEIGRTEYQENTLEPIFDTKILLEYSFSSNHTLKFEVYDIDLVEHKEEKRVILKHEEEEEKDIDNSKKALEDIINLSGQDFMGMIEISVHELVKNMYVKKKLIDKSGIANSGEIHIQVEKADAINNDIISIEVGIEKVIKQGKIYFTLNRSSNQDWGRVYTSETLSKGLQADLKWNTFNISLNSLCSKKINLPLKIKIHNYDDLDNIKGLVKQYLQNKNLY